MKQGWIALHRQLQDHWLWSEKPFSKGQAWIDLLMLANHEDKEIVLGNKVINVEAGSFITSELKLMDRWGWGKEKTRAFLKLLEENKMIRKVSDHRKTTIFIDNYAVYQDNPNNKADHCQTTVRLLSDTNNNDNNENKELSYSFSCMTDTDFHWRKLMARGVYVSREEVEEKLKKCSSIEDFYRQYGIED